MSSNQPLRSVRFTDQERGAWSSDRPRRGGDAHRLPDISTRCRVLRPADRLRYAPGSLLVVVAPSAAERDRFAARVLEDRAAYLTLDKVRALLRGRVADDELEERAAELLQAAARKRLEAGEAVVLGADGLDADEREPYVRIAHAARRPRHLLLLEAGRDKADDDTRAALDELRRLLVAGQLGAEGIQTALRLSGPTVDEVKRILFRPAPRDE